MKVRNECLGCVLAEKEKKMLIKYLRIFDGAGLYLLRPAGLKLWLDGPLIRRKKLMRMLLPLMLFSSGFTSVNDTEASEGRGVYLFDIPSLRVEEALSRLASQTEHQLLFSYELVDSMKSSKLLGKYTVTEGMGILLQGTGLSGQLTERGVIVVTHSSTHKYSNVRADKMNSKKNFMAAALALLFSSGGASQHALAQNEGSSETYGRMEEIIVTSQKRAERLQDVPIPVTAVSASQLAERSEYRLQDFYSKVPGLSMTPNALGGTATIAIRGVTSGDFAAPTVGIVVDELPFGSSTLLGGGFLVPELDPIDLERIEVLRGPQGTLYGASSVGGLLKYVTKDPSTEGVSGRVQAGSSSVREGNDIGYNVSGSINLPISDTFAIRASTFTRKDPGYIDNIGYGGGPVDEDTNETETKGVQLTALWEPSDEFSLRLNGFNQENEISGSPFVTLADGVGELEQRFLPGTGWTERKFQGYAAVAKATFGDIEMVSLTGYNKIELNDSYDITEPAGFFVPLVFPGASPFAENQDFTETTKFTQEVRLTMPLGPRVDWLVGGFYTREKTPWVEPWIATEPDGSQIDTFVTFDFASKYRDQALFTNLTFQVTDRIDVQVGGRWSDIRTSFVETDTGPWVAIFESLDGSEQQSIPKTILEEEAFTYLVSPRFMVSNDVMVYARLSSGYRPGGINPFGALENRNATFDADETQNYELGVKATILDKRLYVEGSLYRIDWDDIQIQLSSGGLEFFENAGRAKIEGLELSAKLFLTDQLSVSSWISWNQAELAEDVPANSIVAGAKGDPLPFSSEFSASASIEYDFPVGQYTATVGGDFSLVDDRAGNLVPEQVLDFDTFELVPGPSREEYGSYEKIDLRANLEMEDWNVGVFINNVSDERGVLGGGVGSFISDTAFTVVQPRTVGLSVSKTFN